MTDFGNDLVEYSLLKPIEALGLQLVLFVFVQPSTHIVLDGTALNDGLVVFVKFFLEILKLFLDLPLSLAIQGFDARSSFFIDTDNHSGSPSSVRSLGDRTASIVSTLVSFSHSVLPLSNWYV